MFHKREGPDYSEANSFPKRLRRNYEDLHLTNQLSGPRVLSLFKDAHGCNLEIMEDIANMKFDSHVSRNLTRKMIKGCKWPKLFQAKVRCLHICFLVQYVFLVI